MNNKSLSFLRKLTGVILSVIIVASIGVPAFASDDSSTGDYIIESPYEGIDWDAYKAYKTQLHAHTNASDGYLTLREFVEAHYALDYDIVALTDHGTINPGWDRVPETVPLMRFIKKDRTQMAPIIPLTKEEYQSYLNGTQEKRTYTTEAGDVLTRTHTNGMLDVPKGIELNMATPIADCHLTGYFADYGQGLAGVFGDYETPSKGVMEAGGISFLSHVGEYVYTDKDSENYVGKPVDDYYATKFARLFLDYYKDENGNLSSLGMGINSATDAHTRCDRILYDQVLQKTIPNGVVPWGNTFSDSHNERSLNDAYVWSIMPELTLDAFRACMEKGQFFSVSHYSNGVELNGMEEMPGYTESYIVDNNLYYLDTTPNITKLSVNHETDVVTVECENANLITWVSNGNVIKREPVTNGTATLDLYNDKLLAEPYLYLRCYVSGDNGICYANPLTLKVKGEEFKPVEVEKVYDLPAFLRGLVTIIDLAVFRVNPVTWDRLTNPF